MKKLIDQFDGTSLEEKKKEGEKNSVHFRLDS
jgi:hypothetical protein